MKLGTVNGSDDMSENTEIKMEVDEANSNSKKLAFKVTPQNATFTMDRAFVGEWEKAEGEMAFVACLESVRASFEFTVTANGKSQTFVASCPIRAEYPNGKWFILTKEEYDDKFQKASCHGTNKKECSLFCFLFCIIILGTSCRKENKEPKNSVVSENKESIQEAVYDDGTGLITAQGLAFEVTEDVEKYTMSVFSIVDYDKEEFTIPSKLKYDGQVYRVTVIGNSAFEGETKLKKWKSLMG